MVADLVLPDIVKKSLRVLDEATFPFLLGMPIYNLPRWKLHEAIGNTYAVSIEGLPASAAKNIQTAFNDAGTTCRLERRNTCLVVPLSSEGLDEGFLQRVQADVRERPGLIPYVGDRLKVLNNLDIRGRGHFDAAGQKQNLWGYQISTLEENSPPEPHFRLVTGEPITAFDQNPKQSQICRRQKFYASCGIETEIAGNRHGQACLIIKGQKNMDAIINATFLSALNGSAAGQETADRPAHTGPGSGGSLGAPART